MKRRQFNQGAIGAGLGALFHLSGCGGGGGGVGAGATGDAAGVGPSTPAPGPAIDAPAAVRKLRAMGTNFSGMEWAQAGLRSSLRTMPNVDWTVPRDAEVRHLAFNGFGLNRLPFRWEMLQPMLVDTPASAAARAAIGEPGAFHPAYARAIDRMLDAHAAAGARCILDLHNYARYRDFRFQPDGSVRGLVRPSDPLLHAYTTDASQVWMRIVATAPGASLRPAALADLWRRAALRWRDHPGFGGYGLMNEPYDLPRPGEIVESEGAFGQDLMIWPAFARAAIEAIRAVDPVGTIYLGGNNWGGAMNIGAEWNPAWPLQGVVNLVYEVHCYVDAWNNGAGWDWELELAKNHTAGVGDVPMTLDTGVDRLRIATAWAREQGVRIALTETGMPVDDTRWYEAFRRMVRHAQAEQVPVQTWMGGSHWPIRNAPTNHASNWYQHRSMEALVAGELKAAAGMDQAVLFDAGPGDAAGGPVTITVFARGSLAQPLALRVASDAGGRFSKTELLIPAGANGQDSYSYAPEPDRASILRYDAGDRQVPPPRTVYSLRDPLAHAALAPDDAARAILARHAAAHWDLAHGHTDYVEGALPAAAGEAVRAVADTGFASQPGNAMDMLCTANLDDPGGGPIGVPVLRIVNGRKGSDHAGRPTGLWCKKWTPGASFPRPRNRIPFGLADPHFVVVALTAGAAGPGGPVFQACFSNGGWCSELLLSGGVPRARWRDTRAQEVLLDGAPALAPGQFAVLSFTQAPGAQQLRVGGVRAAASSARLEPAPLDSLLIGFGFLDLLPQPGFGGIVHAVLAGPGVPGEAELALLEQYLVRTAGLA